MSEADTQLLGALISGIDADARTFDADTARAAGATEQNVADFSAVLSGASWRITGEAIATPSAALSDLGAEIAACRGQNGYTGWHGAFWQFALNSCNTDVLISMIGGHAGGVAAIGGLLAAMGVPPGAIIGAVGVIAGLGTLPYIICKNASGNGAIYVNIFPTGAGCWGQ